MLLQQIKIAAERADGKPMVPTGGIGQPPPGRLQVDRQTRQKGGRASDQLRVGPPCRKLRQVRKIRTLRERDLDRIRHVTAGPGTNSGGLNQWQLAVLRGGGHAPVAEMVALPTTRESA